MHHVACASTVAYYINYRIELVRCAPLLLIRTASIAALWLLCRSQPSSPQAQLSTSTIFCQMTGVTSRTKGPSLHHHAQVGWAVLGCTRVINVITFYCVTNSTANQHLWLGDTQQMPVILRPLHLTWGGCL